MKWYELHEFICTQLKEKWCHRTNSELIRIAIIHSYEQAISDFNEIINLLKNGLNQDEIIQLKSFVGEFKALCERQGLNSLEETNLYIDMTSYIIENNVSTGFTSFIDKLRKEVADLEKNLINNTQISSREIDVYAYNLIDSYYQKALILEEILPHADFFEDCLNRKHEELLKIEKLNQQSDWRVKLSKDKALELIQKINIEQFRKPDGKFIISRIVKKLLDQNPDLDITERRLWDIIKSLIENGEID
ncbi:MAG: hypothetical protein WDZ80_00525 [Candidatus Paceibacterota bacterium]